MLRPITLLLLLAAWWVLVWLAPLPVRAQDKGLKPSDARIKAAIDRASQFLLSKVVLETDGPAAVAVIALIKSGTRPDNSQIRIATDKLASRISGSRFIPQVNHVYEAGVSLMALANTDVKKYRPQIEVLAEYIIQNQGPSGQWHYPGSLEGDTSISQYAMLGLWEASRAGVVVPMEVWDKAADWHIRTQQSDGGFAYHPQLGGGGGAISSLHSMSAAGIGSLRIARRHLFPGAKERVVIEDVEKKAKKNRSGKRFGVLEPFFRDEEEAVGSDAERASLRNASYVPKVKLAELDAAVDKGTAWMTKNFTVTNPRGYPIYFLYGLERASALAEMKTYGTHDWYDEGAAHLLSTQNAISTWSDSCGEVCATAFGVLFLAKATAKMVGPTVSRVEFGTGILVGGRGLPDQLGDSKLDDGKVKKSQKITPLEELLGQLENPQMPLLETTQAEIVEQVVIGDRKALIGQTDRLKKLARHKDPEIRRTALWALGRSDDLRLAPILMEGLRDTNIDVYVEARNALRCLSRQVEDFSAKEEPIDAATREQELAKWKVWYKSVRAYDERDDLVAPGE